MSAAWPSARRSRRAASDAGAAAARRQVVPRAACSAAAMTHAPSGSATRHRSAPSGAARSLRPQAALRAACGCQPRAERRRSAFGQAMEWRRRAAWEPPPSATRCSSAEQARSMDSPPASALARGCTKAAALHARARSRTLSCRGSRSLRWARTARCNSAQHVCNTVSVVCGWRSTAAYGSAWNPGWLWRKTRQAAVHSAKAVLHQCAR